MHGNEKGPSTAIEIELSNLYNNNNNNNNNNTSSQSLMIEYIYELKGLSILHCIKSD